MRISDWSSDVCSSDLRPRAPQLVERHAAVEDVAADQPETGFEIIGRQREMADHRLPEAGCCRFDGIENRRDGGVAMRLPAARNGGIEMLAEQACDMLAGRCEAVVDEARDQHLDDGAAGPAVRPCVGEDRKSTRLNSRHYCAHRL